MATGRTKKDSETDPTLLDHPGSVDSKETAPTVLDHSESGDPKETAPTVQMTLSASLMEVSQTFTRKPSLESFADYEIEGELGRGGMGIVYLARQKNLNRRVALKMLTGHYGPNELQRFMEEAETAAGLNHINILHVYEVGEHEGAPYFSMEFVEGGSLADKLRKGLPTPRETAELMISIARALQMCSLTRRECQRLLTLVLPSVCTTTVNSLVPGQSSVRQLTWHRSKRKAIAGMLDRQPMFIRWVPFSTRC
jgi:serine/threonine protein kinase